MWTGAGKQVHTFLFTHTHTHTQTNTHTHTHIYIYIYMCVCVCVCVSVCVCMLPQISLLVYHVTPLLWLLSSGSSFFMSPFRIGWDDCNCLCVPIYEYVRVRVRACVCVCVSSSCVREKDWVFICVGLCECVFYSDDMKQTVKITLE